MTDSTMGTNPKPKNTLLKIREKWYRFLDDYDHWAEIEAWKGYVKTYQDIVNDSKTAKPLGVSETGIQFVAGHLDILDRKFGILMTFQGLMATIVAIYISASLPHPVTNYIGSSNYLHTSGL